MGKRKKYYHTQDNARLLELILNSPEHADNTKTVGIFRGTTAFFFLALISGILASLLALPLALPIDITVNTAQNYWDTLDVDLPEPFLPQRSIITDDEGKEIAQFFSQNRIIVPLEEVSDHVLKALISTEDQSFYSHGGVDWLGVGRATLNNLQHDGTQGGSTITQQLVKNTLIISATNKEDQAKATEQSLNRKIKEVRYALALEQKLDKNEILEKYLNTVLYARGIYGIETASQYYFNTKALDLTIPQAALLVGILQNPSGYDPITNPENATKRRNTVLKRMLDTRAITPQEYETAINTELELTPHKPDNGCVASPYPHYCQYVINSVLTDPRFGETQQERERTLYTGGLTIQTSLNRATQDAMQKVVDQRLGRNNRVAAGIAAIEPGTGKIVALVQNRDWGDQPQETQKDNIQTEIIYADSKFQPGSVFKILTAITALEEGYAPTHTITAPTRYTSKNMITPKGGIRNSGSAGAGRMTLKRAITVSSNTYFAILQEQVGVLKVRDMSRKLGVEIDDSVGTRDSSFTLGSKEVTPISMAGVYATIASGGTYCEPTAITTATRIDGKKFENTKPNCYQAIHPTTAQVLQDALISVTQPGGTGTRANLNGGRVSLGKTGTTTSHSAVWYVGSTPQLTTAVWMGDPRGGFKYPLKSGVRIDGKMTYRVYGGDIAASLWKTLMEPVRYGDASRTFTPTSGGVTSTVGVMPSLVGLDAGVALGLLENFTDLTVRVDYVDGVGADSEELVVFSQSVLAGQEFIDSGVVTLVLGVNDG